MNRGLYSGAIGAFQEEVLAMARVLTVGLRFPVSSPTLKSDEPWSKLLTPSFVGLRSRPSLTKFGPWLR